MSGSNEKNLVNYILLFSHALIHSDSYYMRMYAHAPVCVCVYALLAGRQTKWLRFDVAALDCEFIKFLKAKI